jgi:hypothetical protein
MLRNIDSSDAQTRTGVDLLAGLMGSGITKGSNNPSHSGDLPGNHACNLRTHHEVV